jgi:hypothetical protein
MADENYIDMEQPSVDDEIASELAYLDSAIDETPHPELDGPAPGTPEEEALLFPWRGQPTIDMEQPAGPGEAPLVMQGGSVGVRQSYTGFGPDMGQGAIWKKGYEEFGQNDQRLRANTQIAGQEFDAAYDQKTQALNNQADIEAEYHNELAAIHSERMDFLRESAALDELMYAEAKADSQKYLESYQQQLAAVRQMSVTSPMQTIGKVEFAGASVAAFAQGFLAAQGINIDVIGQINRWEEMSIREQERKIQQAEKGAQDQLHLWEIARQTSRDDLEARQRYRGMILEQFGAAIDMQAARFAAPLARAAADTAKAQLEMERANVMNSLRSNYETQRLANLKGMRDEMHKRVEERRLSRLADAEISYKNKLGEAALNKPAAQGKAPNLIIDSRNVMRSPDGKVISGGRVVAELSHDAPAETQKKVIGTKSLNDAVQGGMEELRQLYKEVEAEAGPGWMRRRGDPHYALFDAERNRIIGDIMRNFTGLAATDKEAERWLNQLKDDAFLQAGPDRLPQLMDGMSKWARRSFEDSLDLPGVIKYDQNKQYHTQDIQVDPEGSALERARKSTHVPGQVENLAGAVVPSVTLERAMSPGKVEKWAVELEDIARAAVDPAKFLSAKAVKDVARSFNIPESLAETLASKKLSEDPEAARETAKFILVNAAYGNPLKEGQPALPAQRKEYARKLLEAYESDPQALLKALSE